MGEWSDPVPIPHSGKRAPFPTSSNTNLWSQRTAYCSAQLYKIMCGLLQILIQASHFSRSVFLWFSVNVSERQ